MAKSKKRRKILIFSAIGIVLIALTLVAVLKRHKPVISVQTEKVTRRDITETVVANGRIQPVTQVHISAEVSGEIIALPVKEGEFVHKGDLLVKIKPDYYVAALNQAKARYESSLAGKTQAQANLDRAQAEFKRNTHLFDDNLIPESDYISYKANYEVAKAQLESASHEVEVARASVDSAQDSLDKTTIVSPLDGTIVQLNSQLGERVLGTVQNAGTDIMIIADLNEMEARVDVGEMDVVIMKHGLKARLDVDAFKDKEFTGIVTDVANSAEGLSASSGNQQATKFQVRIHVNEKAAFRPGMSVTSEIETRYRTNVLTVPFASVTARAPKEKPKPKSTGQKAVGTNSPATNTPALASSKTNQTKLQKKKDDEKEKSVEVVFVVEGDHVKMTPVKTGISDDSYWEITEGLKEGQEIVSGGFRAISRELEDGKLIRRTPKGKNQTEEK